MTIFRKNKPDADRDRFLETARSHLGYRTRPSGLSDFAVRTGYKGEMIPWSGAFIDCVARDAGVFMPACVYTPSGLGEFIADGRLVRDPEPGDIVFFSFPTTVQFGMPHVGIVSDVEGMTAGYFKSIEAQVSSGLPRSSTSADGVFERVRWRHETIAFARPDFRCRPGIERVQTGNVSVKVRNVQPGRRSADVAAVQVALVQVAGLRIHETGVFDSATQQAYSRWERRIGRVYPDSQGVPDESSLRLLGQFTGHFQVSVPSEEN